MASVQPQIPGNVVFTQHPVGLATLTGVAPQAAVQQQQNPSGTQQQLMVQGGQAITPQFSGAFQPNTQPQLIQASNMGVLNSMQPVQVIGTNGQQYYPQFYTSQMQPMLLNNLIPITQNGQSISLLPPNATNGNAIITGQAQTTPVKNQTIVKGVSISPQQQSRPNANSNNKNNQATSTTQQPTIIQTPNNNPTLVIGIPNTPNGSINMSTTPTNARKSKIPTQQIISSAAFKTSPTFNAAANSNGQQNSPTIMVHGQNIPHGTGSIQLASNQQLFSPLTSFQTIQPSQFAWQQAPQLVTQNGQILLRQNQNDSPQMFIQTSNNQFQAMPMQMAQSPQTQNPNAAGMQVTSTGQQMMAPSLNQSIPMSIQNNSNLSMSSNQLVSPQNKPKATSPSNSPTVTSSSMGQITQIVPRQRPLRPAGQQTPNSTQTVQQANKPKTMDGTINVKLAPKSPIGVKNSFLKLPLPPLQKSNEIGTQVTSSTGANNLANNNNNTNNNNNNNNINSNSTSNNNLTNQNNNNKTVTVTLTEKISTPQSISTTVSSSIPLTTSINVVTGSKSEISKFKKPSSSSINSISTNTTGTSTSSSTTITSSENNQSLVSTTSVNNVKSILRSASNFSKSNVPQASSSSSSAASSSTGTQLVNKNSSANQNSNKNSGLPNGILKKPNTTSSAVVKTKSDVLTHVVDGYVIQESGNPFPINSYVPPIKDYGNSINIDLIQAGKNDICTICNKNKRMENPQKKRWKNYCQSCVNKFNESANLLTNIQGSSKDVNLLEHFEENQTDSQTQLTTVKASSNVNGVVNTAAVVTLPSSTPSCLLSSSSTTLKRTQNQMSNSSNNNDEPSKRVKLNNTISNDNINMNGTNEDNQNDDEDLWIPENAPDPRKWTVDQVCEFIAHLDGCGDLVEGFRAQEIDGQALLLIKEEHIIDILNTKLGPALKIILKINILKDRIKNSINISNNNNNSTNVNTNSVDEKNVESNNENNTNSNNNINNSSSSSSSISNSH